VVRPTCTGHRDGRGQHLSGARAFSEWWDGGDLGSKRKHSPRWRSVGELWDELTEEAGIHVLHSLAGVNPEFVPQQDSEPLVRRERLRSIAVGRERAHQKQMS
jgi:hypothetical protein